MRFGLIGKSLEHSFSGAFFSKKFDREGIEASYELIELPNLSDLKKAIQERKLDGFNVTIPYKEEILPFLDDINEDALQIGAVNCVKIKDGKWMGYNTDHAAFASSLQPYLPGIKKALILGSGGASKAVAFALDQLSIPHQVVSRTGPLTYRKLSGDTIKESQLIVQTTPLGMNHQENDAPAIPYRSLSADHLVYDLIYNPPQTLFLQIAKFNGAMIMNGNEMLEKQALLSWDIWTGGQ